MSKKEKLLRKIRNNPKAVSFKDLSKLLDYFDFDTIGIRGSHHKYRRMVQDEDVVVIIPRRKPHVLPVYVKDVLKVIKEIEEIEND